MIDVAKIKELVNIVKELDAAELRFLLLLTSNKLEDMGEIDFQLTSALETKAARSFRIKEFITKRFKKA